MSMISSGGSSVDVIWEVVDVKEILSVPVVDSVKMLGYAIDVLLVNETVVVESLQVTF